MSQVPSKPKKPYKSLISAKLVIMTFLARNEFLKLVGAPNESLRIIIIYYMFKYTFGIKTTLLESLRNKKLFKDSI